MGQTRVHLFYEILVFLKFFITQCYYLCELILVYYLLTTLESNLRLDLELVLLSTTQLRFHLDQKTKMF